MGRDCASDKLTLKHPVIGCKSIVNSSYIFYDRWGRQRRAFPLTDYLTGHTITPFNERCEITHFKCGKVIPTKVGLQFNFHPVQLLTWRL